MTFKNATFLLNVGELSSLYCAKIGKLDGHYKGSLNLLTVVSLIENRMDKFWMILL